MLAFSGWWAATAVDIPIPAAPEYGEWPKTHQITSPEISQRKTGVYIIPGG
jgi:hypothetical protein